jgi:hypothetical protein
MAELILGIVVDILRHVPIEIIQRVGVGRVPSGGKSWNLAVLDSAKLGILLPEIVDSADGWDEVLKPVVARYRGKVSLIYFRRRRLLFRAERLNDN